MKRSWEMALNVANAANNFIGRTVEHPERLLQNRP